MSEAAEHLGLARQRLRELHGPEYWRSLDELAQNDEFQALVEREFPSWAAVWDEVHSRRQFLKLMAASFALAGLSGCGQAPREEIVPYVRQPEGVVPGRPLYYATAMPLSGYATGGLLVKSLLGRPIKVEGNPSHPGSPAAADAPAAAAFGPSDLFAQASVLTLYDPDRAQAATHLGQIRSWEQFQQALSARLQALPRDGDGLCVLTETVTSPTLVAQLEALRRRYPAARWYVHEPVSRDNARAGAIAAFGRPLEPRYHFERADVVLALEADFLNRGAGRLRSTRDFMARRGPAARVAGTMNRLYAIESMPTGTGARADHRLPLRSSQIESFAAAVAARLGVNVAGASTDVGVRPEWIAALADDLARHRGRGVVLAGENQPPLVHALAHALNMSLGNIGQTVRLLAPIEARPEQPAALADLTDRLERREVRVLVILGGNPVYTAPADVPFEAAVAHAGLAVHVSPYRDETAANCHWHIPESHYLETWGDVRAFDGTVSLIQPLIAPLYISRSILEVLAALTASHEGSGHELVRTYWQQRGLPRQDSAGFERAWRRALHDGFIEGAESVEERAALQANWAAAPGAPASSGSDQSLEVLLQPDPTVYDGRFANNGWLQELPKPLSKLTWDNAAYLSPATAVRLGLASAVEQAERANGLEIELIHQGRRLSAPVWVQPGHADGSITLDLGYGRSRAGRVGNRLGVNAYALRPAAAPWHLGGVAVRATGRRRQLATTQTHHLMENRDLVRHGTVQSPPHGPEAGHASRRMSLYPEYRYEGNKWGMTIDLSACTGCGACVVACQAENNIPVVGKDEVLRGREMHWLRVDSYYHGEPAAPQTFFQPVPCMHCENAPCEIVCPVMATVHSSDGLNDMVYNRCVGTRYCSNNCPYKVRRFNFLQYSDFETPSLQLLRNPDVTVRSRGVMEKCTYCVQRIRTVQIDAARDGDRRIRDGEVQTACQSACPARAIVFGDLNDRDAQGRPLSKVAQMQDDPLNYGLLQDLNTRPRTTYLPAISNPNPALPAEWRTT
ncbi:MAG: TAT-variant-translocated molybdopterin oxidoreductase [Gemmataceae bacterium]|nr:TAT-variant-translocated molybdopterin oxidoreductase [Gemmataceae bacterium]